MTITLLFKVRRRRHHRETRPRVAIDELVRPEGGRSGRRRLQRRRCGRDDGGWAAADGRAPRHRRLSRLREAVRRGEGALLGSQVRIGFNKDYRRAVNMGTG